ncbi:MAG: pentapeptide repeat-containing protein [Betaproteobacteria bacterium]
MTYRDKTLPDNFSGEVFYQCDLSRTKFTGNLDGTIFKQCCLYQTDFTGANITHRTKIDWSGMRSPIEAGAKFTNKQKALLRLRDRSRER